MWFVEHVFMIFAAQAIVGRVIQTFQEFPPRQKPSSFNVGDAIENDDQALEQR
jgi:arylsulfatase